ncbi:MAG: dihydrofolate reductase [Bacillota bacterium]
MFSLVVAYDEKRVIGKDGDLPWHFKEDLQYFKRITEHHPVVMGRKTYDSIVRRLKRPLPNRENIVVTRKQLPDKGITVVNDFKAYLEAHKHDDEEIFIIGGSSIFEDALPYTHKLYITHIEGTYEGDTFFPAIDFTDFIRIYTKKSGPLTFSVYERVR